MVLLTLAGVSACSSSTMPGADVSEATSPSAAHERFHDESSGTASAHSGRWVPGPGDAWQWQLTGDLDLSIDVPIYDLDWETSPRIVEDLHRLGRHVICYVSVGTWEAYRPDADAIPEEVRGAPLSDYPDERWLDIRRIDLLAAPLLARLDRCKAAGFDAVEPDNVDAYTNDSGFDLSPDDQLRFNRWIARAVRARGMAVALKNDLDQVRELVDDFDFAVNEQCVEYEECTALLPFVDAGKAVLHAEYNVSMRQMCATTDPLGFSSIRKNQKLDAYRQSCSDTERDAR
jgi:hypothetical protein